MDKWEYQDKPCYLENSVVREPSKRKTACILIASKITRILFAKHVDLYLMNEKFQKETLHMIFNSKIRSPVLSVPRKSTSFLQYRSCRIEIILLYPISRSINGIDVTHFYSAKKILTMGSRRIWSRI